VDRQWLFGRIFALALLLSLSMAACIQPMTVAPSALQANPRLTKLTGSWQMETTVVQQATTFPALLTFTSDGIVIADEPPSPFETSGHGNWIATGPDTANFTFLALIGSAEGPLSATIKVIGSLHYDASADTWAGPFTVQVTDAQGGEVLADRGTFQGTRIAVETVEQEAINRMSAAEPKPILAVFDLAFESSEQYDQLTKELEAAGAGSPPGRLYHLAYAKDGGIVVADVWASGELLDQFAQTLVPVLQKDGVTPVQPQLYPVHNIIQQ
jgi:hypothetical protein